MDLCESPQPFLRWAGSKRKLLPYLAKYWQNGRYVRYIEPFAGSACLFFYLIPKKAILTDINFELISTYKEVRDDLPSVLESLSKLSVEEHEYYRIRALRPCDLSASQRAARFIYLNRCCFNGLFRTNSKGDFNVPYGAKKAGSFPADKSMRLCANLLNKAQLLSCDFESALGVCLSNSLKNE
jgi:DNA adenine methylase